MTARELTAEINVLQLINGEFVAGAERVQEMLLQHLDRCRFTPRCVALIEGEFVQQLRRVSLPVEVVPMRYGADVRVVGRLARQMRKWEINLVHTHTVRTHLIGRVAAGIAKVPVVTHVHSHPLEDTASPLRNRVNATLERLTRRGSSHYICVSHNLRARLIAEGLPAEHITVISNGIEMERFSRADRGEREKSRRWIRDKLDLPADARLLAMIALFRPRKGAEVFVDAFGRIAGEHPNAYALLVGDFESPLYRDRVLRQVKRLGSEQSARVRLLGFREDIPQILGGTEIVGLPALQGEGLPIVILEAMAMGIPVVATSVGGIPEVIADGWTGYLVEPGDAAAFAEALARLLDDPAGAAEVGKRAEHLVRTDFSAEAMVRGVEQVYLRLVR